jgi:hypothetical protein
MTTVVHLPKSDKSTSLTSNPFGLDQERGIRVSIIGIPRAYVSPSARTSLYSFEHCLCVRSWYAARLVRWFTAKLTGPGACKGGWALLKANLNPWDTVVHAETNLRDLYRRYCSVGWDTYVMLQDITIMVPQQHIEQAIHYVPR